MNKILWGYKTVATIADTSGMYRVSFGRLSDLYEWHKAARDEFIKAQRLPTACFEITREQYDDFDVSGAPRGYAVHSGDVDGPVQMVAEWKPI